MRRIGIQLCLVVFLCAGCGGDDGETQSDVDAMIVSDAVEAMGGDTEWEAPQVSGLDDAICDEILERINGCGLYYSFENFEADCSEWAATGEAARLDALQQCAIKPCQPLQPCLEDVFAL